MADTPLGTAVEILQLINTLEPTAINLVKTFLTGIQGKSTAELLAQSNDVWQGVIDTANKELGQ